MRTLKLLPLLLAFVFISSAATAQDFKEIEKLLRRNYIKTASEKLSEMEKKALQNHDCNTLLGVYKYQRTIASQEDTLSSFITNLEKKTKKIAPPCQNLLYLTLAQTYQDYYSENRYKILKTTQLEHRPADIAQWSTQDFAAKIDSLYMLALSNEQILAKTKYDYCPVVVEKGNLPESIRPTLYDMIAYYAIDYYKDPFAKATEVVKGISLKNKDLYLPPKQFATLDIKTTSERDYNYKIIKLYQKLTTLHLKDKNYDALIEATLERLEFLRDENGLKYSYEPEKNTLNSLIKTYTSSQYVSMAKYKLAKLEYYKRNNDTAVHILTDIIHDYPSTAAADLAKELKYRIQEQFLDFSVERWILPNENFPIHIEAKNISKVYYKIVDSNLKISDRALKRLYPDQIFLKLKEKPSIVEGVIELPDNKDYRMFSTEYVLPKLPEGVYAIFLSTNPKFSTKNGITEVCYFNSSQITATKIREYASDKVIIEFFNRKNGQNLPKVRVKETESSYYNATDTITRRFISNSKGRIEFTPRLNWMEIIAEKGKSIYWLNLYKNSGYASDRTFSSQKIFLDRKIYRPGQTVYFKILSYTFDGEKVELEPNSQVSVTIRDANYQIVKELTLTTNKYGTVSGSFVIPTDRLTGRWRIGTDESGESFSVEEYKRPTFEITFDEPEGNIIVGQKIPLKGKAVSYSGVGLNNATVKYNITASTFNPYRWWWFYFRPTNVTIAHGETTTDAQGNFTINFRAEDIAPDQSWPVKYNVEVVVTDINGETQTSYYSVKAGKQSVYPETDLPKQIRTPKHGVTVFIRNINGQPLKNLTGDLQVYQLIYPSDKPLIDKKWDAPLRPVYTLEQWRKLLPYYPYKTEADLDKMKTGKLFLEKKVKDNDKITLQLKPGLYKLILTVQDPVTHKKVTNVAYTTVYDLKSKKVPYPEKFYVLVEKDTLEKGEKLNFVVGTGFKNVWVHYRVEENQNIIADTAIRINAEQKRISINLGNKVKYGVHLTCYLQAQNRFYKKEHNIYIKQPSKKLDFKLETFRDKLQPGQQEQWTITILNHQDGKPADAEVLASMYDASLDAFATNKWNFALPKLEINHSEVEKEITDLPQVLTISRISRYIAKNYYPSVLIFNDWSVLGLMSLRKMGKVPPPPQQSPDAPVLETVNDELAFDIEEETETVTFNDVDVEEEEIPQAPKVQIRENFAETAFFYPTLHTDKQGRVVIKFTAPESLTRWNFQMFAHDKQLNYGLMFKEVITSKELMITPNEPRFLRQGDTLYFTAKIANTTDKKQEVKAKLQFSDVTGQKAINIVADRELKTVTIEPKSSATVSWRVIVPMNLTEPVMYTVKAYNDKVSDGQRNILPVLNNRILVTETMPMPVKAHERKTFVFKHMANPKSGSIESYRLTLEFNSNPAWYALTAMPYIMEYPYECNEQLFSRFYSNSLATYIINSNPAFKHVFQAWQKEGSPGMLSNLEKNQELKQVILEETPWVMQGKDETENRQRLAMLFDLNKMASEKEAALDKLLERQNPNGGWGWWSGMESDWFITQYIVSGMVKLDSRGVIDIKSDKRLSSALTNACKFIDTRFNKYYRDLKKVYDDKQLYNRDLLSPIVVDYMYLRERLKKYDFGLKGNSQAIKLFEHQLNRFWYNQSLYTLSTEALYFNSKNNKVKTDSIIRSLREQATTDEELGMYWKRNRAGWLWYQAPIETQARIIEAFATATGDTEAVEQMKVWLLKNKQANSWPTTKATTEAIYALTFYGNNWFADNKQVEITVGQYKLPDKNDKTEAGTGYFKHTWTGEEITKSMATVKVNNPNNHIAWGALYWQYFENMDKVVAHQNKELKLSKQYFIERNTDKGKQLQEITVGTPIRVGDIVVVRLVLEADRDMDYVQLKDARPTGFEPVNQLSGYKWKNGLGYYEAPKDASTNFFISHLRPGKYVFEYRLKATIAGSFSTGITTFQCMYAPEFNAHSAGMRIEVKR